MNLISGLGRSPGIGNGTPLQYACLENSMEPTVHRATMSWTEQLSVSAHACTHTHTHTHVHCRKFTSILRTLQTRWQSHYSSCNNQKHFQGTTKDSLWNKITFGWKPCIKNGRFIKILSTYWEIAKFNYRFSKWKLSTTYFIIF